MYINIRAGYTMTIKEIRQHKNNTIRQQIFTYLIHVRKEISSIDTRFFTVSIEMHMTLSCIAMGILQSLSICFIGKVSSSQIRYQRTPSQGRVSEATLMYYFRKHFFRLLAQKPELYITRIIQRLQEKSEEQWDFLAS